MHLTTSSAPPFQQHTHARAGVASAEKGLSQITYSLDENNAQSARMIFNWDACGVVCICFVYAAAAYADYVAIVWLVQPTFDGS